MDLILNYFFISLPEFYVLTLWGAVVFGHKFHDIKYKALLIGIISAFFSDLMWNLEFQQDGRVFISFAIIFVLYRILLEKSLIKSLFITLFASLSLLISEAIIVSILLQYLDYNIIINNFWFKFLITVVYMSPLIFGLIYLSKKNLYIKLYKPNLEDKKLTYYWFTIIFLVVLQFFMLIYLNYSFYLNYVSYSENVKIEGITLVSIALVVVNILLIIFIIKMMRYQSRQEISRFESNYNQYLENLINKLRMERHDFVNEIQTINGLVQEKMYDHLEDYMNNLVQNIKKVNRAIKIKNITVSALLYTKIEQIEANGVSFIITANTNDTFNMIKGYDLVKIISNLIDNAHRAVTENSTKDPYIELYWGKSSNNAVIRVSNNGPKIGKKTIDLLFKEGYTTKKNAGNSGYGLSIIKSIVDSYKGQISVESNTEITSFTIILPLK